MDDAKTAKTPELSKQVLDITKDAKRLDVMSQQHAQAVGERIAAELSEPALASSIALLVRVAGAKAARLAGEFEATDRALTEEIADDDPPRRARESADTELRAGVTEAREVLTGHYGAGFLATVHLAGPMPRDPEQLKRYAVRAHDALAKLEPGDLPASRIEGAKVSPKKWAALLAKPLAKLTDALDAVQTEAAELVSARTHRSRADAAWTSHARRWEDLFDALLRFAGMDEEADRVSRPVGAPVATTAAEPADPVAPPANGSNPTK